MEAFDAPSLIQGRSLAVQTIPISKIKPNEHNPRHVITPEMVDALAASIQAVGLKNPIKVQKISPQSSVDSRQQNPNSQSQYEYELISGHIRLAAAKKLGWETLPTIVLELTPEQALVEAILDNRGREMTWLDEYLSIEAMQETNPKLTQRDLADQLEMSLGSINRGLKILRALNQASRTLLVQSLNKTGYQPSENAVFRLTDLIDGSTPSPQAQALIEKALGAVIAKEMTEPQVAEMVKSANDDPETSPDWEEEDETQNLGEKALNRTEVASSPTLAPSSASGLIKQAMSSSNGYSAGASGNDSDLDQMDPYSTYWKGLPREIKITRGKRGYRVVMKLTESQVFPVVYGAKTWLENMHDKAVPPRLNAPQVRPSTTPGFRETAGFGGQVEDGNGKGQSKPGFLGQLSQVLKDQMKKITLEANSPSELAHPSNPRLETSGLGAIEDNLAKDAKQAVNYEVRKGMRSFLRGFFN